MVGLASAGGPGRNRFGRSAGDSASSKSRLRSRQLLSGGAGITDHDCREELELCEKKVILSALGFDHHSHVSDYAEVISAAQQCVSGASSDRTGDLLVRIESLTGYGMPEVDIEAGDLWLEDILQGLADDAFRKYDWPMACRCVRSLGYLNLISPETSRDYVVFFGLHQLPNGTFGYLGPDSRGLLSGSGDYRSMDQVNLSISVEALWTIAELATGGDWKLFESLNLARVNRIVRA